jgi:dolichyl-phosphate-mannose-protein mannosyltransferase
MDALLYQLPSTLYQWGGNQLRSRLRSIISGALLLVVVFVYLANGRVIGAGDTVPASYLPISMLREFNFDLDEFTFLYDETARRTYPFVGDRPYFLRYHNDHYLSVYPPGPALLALPLYVLPVIAGMPATSAWVPRLEKLSATLITALSVLFLFWTLRELTTERWALTIASIYAFSTSSLSISSQALWQHGPSQCFLAWSLYLLVKGMRETRSIPYVGFTLASSILMRPTDAVLVLPLGLYVLHQHRSMLLQCGLCALPPLAFLLFYNYSFFGSIAGGYGPGMLDTSSWFWRTPFFEGLSGLLFSPGRGLFIYSPIFLLSLAGIGMAWTAGPLLFKYVSIGPVLGVLLYSKWGPWWGGWTYGPRLLADLAPLLCLFLYPLCKPMERWRPLKAGFITLALLSMGCHVLGAFWYDWRWDGLMGTDRHPERLWQWRDSPLVYYTNEAFYSARRGVSQVVIGLLRPATSSSSPLQLAASYSLRRLDPGPSVLPFPCGLLTISVKTVNVGKAVWLARTKHNQGMVGLGWRWFWEGQEVPASSGGELLTYDVFPRQNYEFTAGIAPPQSPAEYILEVGLLSNGVTWFSAQGVEPLRIAVHVAHPISDEFGNALAMQVIAVDDPPQLTITTDRPRYWSGDRLHVITDVVNTARVHPVDAYLALAWPDGHISFHGHSGGVMEPQGSWIPLAKGMELAKGLRLTVPVLDLPLVDMPSGCYTCYLVLTKPNTSQIIAKAQALFVLEP